MTGLEGVTSSTGTHSLMIQVASIVLYLLHNPSNINVERAKHQSLAPFGRACCDCTYYERGWQRKRNSFTSSY